MEESRKSGPSVHTLGNRREGFRNVQEGKQVGETYKTQKQAIIAGRLLAIESYAEHVIHAMDGKIRSKNSYGNDPESSKG